MALNVSKVMYSKAQRLLAIQSIRDAHAGYKTGGCDKDGYTSGCGSRRVREEPSRICEGDPSNPCRSRPNELPSSCKSVVPEYAPSRMENAAKYTYKDTQFVYKTEGCHKDSCTSGCGSRRVREEPTRLCEGDPSNPCKACPSEFPNPCKRVTTEYASNRLQNAAKYSCKDPYNECYDKGKRGGPGCTEENRVGYKLHVPRTPWQMLYWKPECCPCLPELPRFDELYYKIRKMCEKEYFPTWAECPKPRIVPKVVCCYDKETIEIPRRIRCKAPQTACPQPEDALNKKLLVCAVGGDPNCVKLFTRCCCPARHPPKCIRIRQPVCEGRLQVPSPSFSECCKGPLNPRRNTECRCLLVSPLCAYPPLPSKNIRTC